MDNTLWLVAFAVVLVNLPFGFWREGTRRFSPSKKRLCVG